MNQKQAVNILIRNGAGVYDDNTIDESFTDVDMDPAEADLYRQAKHYLITVHGFTLSK